MSAILRAHAQLASGIASADHDTGHENIVLIHEPVAVLQLTVLRVGAANSSRISQKVLDRYAPSILADWLVMSMQGLRYGKSHVESGRDGACRELRVSNANCKISPRSCVCGGLCNDLGTARVRPAPYVTAELVLIGRSQGQRFHYIRGEDIHM